MPSTPSDYVDRHHVALQYFIAGEKKHGEWVDSPETDSQKEYRYWLDYAIKRLDDDAVSIFPEADFFGNGKVYETFFPLLLGDIIASPNKLASDILKTIYSRPKAYGPLPSYIKAPLKPGLIGTQAVMSSVNALTAVRRTYQGAELPLPAPFEKMYYADHGRKFFKNALMGMMSGNDAACSAIASAAVDLLPHVIGSRNDPISDTLATAIIWTSSEGREVFCVGRDGSPYFFHLPSALATSNRESIALCEREIIDVRAGADPTLTSGKHSCVADLLSSARAMSHMENEDRVLRDAYINGRRRPAGRADVRNRPDVSPPKLIEALEISIRDAVLNIGKAGRGVFTETGHLSPEYRFVKTFIAQRLDQAKDAAIGSLDRDSLFFLNSFDLRGPEIAGWFAGAPDLLPCAHGTRIRQDAEDAFMATGPLFFLAQKPEFRDAITQRKPLLPLVREITGLTKAQVNVISAMQSPSRPDEIIREFPPFEPDAMRGRSLKEIAAAAEVYAVLRAANPDKKPAACAADAVKTLDMSPYERDGYQDAIKALYTLSELISVSTHGRVVDSTTDFLKAVLYPKTVKQIEQINKIYHNQRLWQHEGTGGGHYETVAKWSPLQEAITFDDGYVVRELTSTEEIVRQGLKQSHCVGSYGASVLAKNIILLSVDKDGEPMSTVEVRLPLNMGGRSMGLHGMQRNLISVQHRAFGNRHPDPRDEQMVAEFMRQANHHLITRLEAYNLNMDEANRNAVRIRSGSAEHRFTVLRDILPQKVQLAGYDRLIRLVEERFEVQALHADEIEIENREDHEDYVAF